jgi:hypothetical protein
LSPFFSWFCFVFPFPLHPHPSFPYTFLIFFLLCLSLFFLLLIFSIFYVSLLPSYIHPRPHKVCTCLSACGSQTYTLMQHYSETTRS